MLLRRFITSTTKRTAIYNNNNHFHFNSFASSSSSSSSSSTISNEPRASMSHEQMETDKRYQATMDAPDSLLQQVSYLVYHVYTHTRTHTYRYRYISFYSSIDINTDTKHNNINL